MSHLTIILLRQLQKWEAGTVVATLTINKKGNVNFSSLLVQQKVVYSMAWCPSVKGRKHKLSIFFHTKTIDQIKELYVNYPDFFIVT